MVTQAADELRDVGSGGGGVGSGGGGLGSGGGGVG